MSRTEFWILNIVGGACAVLIVTGLALAHLNRGLNQSVAARRNQFNQAQQLQQTARNLVLRIAQDSQQEPVLRQLLARHNINVNPNTNSPAKPSP